VYGAYKERKSEEARDRERESDKAIERAREIGQVED